jgi:hypothetical protein
MTVSSITKPKKSNIRDFHDPRADDPPALQAKPARYMMSAS